jgi:predicted Zn-dependent protease
MDSYEAFRCQIYYRAKDYERAEAVTRAFLLQNPDDLRGNYILANTLIEGELNPEEGQELINALLERLPENLLLLDSRAFALHKLGRHQEALELLEKNAARAKIFSLKRQQYIQEVREALAGNL